jgi:hypothetical protein
MSREVRTLWWCAQGLLIFGIVASYVSVALGILLLGFHGLGAGYSQFIQGED